MQLELPLGLADEERRPGTKKGRARWVADRAVDAIRDRFGWKAVRYAPVVLGIARSVPDEFRQLGRRPRRAAPSHGRALRYRAPPPYVYPRRGAGGPADEDVAPGQSPYVAIAVMAGGIRVFDVCDPGWCPAGPAFGAKGRFSRPEERRCRWTFSQVPYD